MSEFKYRKRTIEGGFIRVGEGDLERKAEILAHSSSPQAEEPRFPNTPGGRLMRLTMEKLKLLRQGRGNGFRPHSEEVKARLAEIDEEIARIHEQLEAAKQALEDAKDMKDTKED